MLSVNILSTPATTANHANALACALLMKSNVVALAGITPALKRVGWRVYFGDLVQYKICVFLAISLDYNSLSR